MRFLTPKGHEKEILVISDLHLGAGTLVEGKINPLEDFHFDKELVEFLEYYSTGEYASKEVELIINGDFLDFLAVPYIPFFDDEYWSETATLAKLEMILAAHKEVFEALRRFASVSHKKILYIIGNHDAEFLFLKARQLFEARVFPDKNPNFKFYMEGDYSPHPGVMIRHGHEYERAHHFSMSQSILTAQNGELYFSPPWGSYYVTRVVNKFKTERDFINQVRPIKFFLIHGLIFDTLFTIRFLFSNIYYWFMVRFVMFFRKKMKLSKKFEEIKRELNLFVRPEGEVLDLFEQDESIKTVITGHTHDPQWKSHPQGRTYINTGTWTKMVHLDFTHRQDGFLLTYAQIGVTKEGHRAFLHIWKGRSKNPFIEFH